MNTTKKKAPRTVKILNKTFKLWRTFQSVYTAERFAKILASGNCETFIKTIESSNYGLYIRYKFFKDTKKTKSEHNKVN